MKEEAFSILDLLDISEDGLLMKTRKPNMNAFVFGPDEGEYFENPSPPQLSNNLTSSERMLRLQKFALGILDPGISSTPGMSPSNELGGFNYTIRDIDPYLALGKDDIDIPEAWPTTNIDRRDKGDYIDDSDKPEYFDVYSSNESKGYIKMSDTKTELVALANSLRSLGYDKEADRIEKFAEPATFMGLGWLGWTLVAAAVGATGAITYSNFDEADIDDEMAARLGGKMQEFAMAADKLSSWGGADIDAGKVEMLLLKMKEDLENKVTSEPDFQPLYMEIARVFAGQDFKMDAHWGWFGGNDAGDMPDHFPNIQSEMIARFSGQEISLEDIKQLFKDQGFENWYNWGHDSTFTHASGEIGNYVAAWNSLVQLEATTNEAVEQLVAAASEDSDTTEDLEADKEEGLESDTESSDLTLGDILGDIPEEIERPEARQAPRPIVSYR